MARFTDIGDTPRAEPTAAQLKAAADALVSMSQPLQALDIWDAFDGSLSGDWDATTYANWIAGFDAHFASELSSGAVEKVTLGLSSDGTRNLYLYIFECGPEPVLLLSGQHGEEKLGMYASMRYFEQFIRSGSSSMAYQRARTSLYWIPTANPYGYDVQNTDNSTAAETPMVWTSTATGGTSIAGTPPLARTIQRAVRRSLRLRRSLSRGSGYLWHCLSD